MDLADVLVNADEAYHVIHSIYNSESARKNCIQAWPEVVQEDHTMSFGETGARSAPAISCAFWLTLPPRVRMF